MSTVTHSMANRGHPAVTAVPSSDVAVNVSSDAKFAMILALTPLVTVSVFNLFGYFS